MKTKLFLLIMFLQLSIFALLSCKTQKYYDFQNMNTVFCTNISDSLKVVAVKNSNSYYLVTYNEDQLIDAKQFLVYQFEKECTNGEILFYDFYFVNYTNYNSYYIFHFNIMSDDLWATNGISSTHFYSKINRYGKINDLIDSVGLHLRNEGW